MPKVRYADFVKKLMNADIFTMRILESKMGKNYAKQFVHNNKTRIVEIAKGVYSFKKDPFVVLTFLGKAYVGLGYAASLHGMWDQATAITVLSPYAGRRMRTGERMIGGWKVMVRRISMKMYFGFEIREVDGRLVRVSDPEKTVIDMIYFNYPFLEEMDLSICDKKKMETYVGLMKKRKIKGWKKVSRWINENWARRDSNPRPPA